MDESRYELLVRGDATTLAAGVTEALSDPGSPLAKIAPVDLAKCMLPKARADGLS